MSGLRTRRAAAIAIAGLVPLAAPFALSGTAYAHGYSQNPASRQLQCSDGTVTGCGEIEYEPQSVEGPKGFPEAGPADGSLCAGGNERFAQLDDPSRPWKATSLTSGQDYEFSWQIPVPHSTSTFDYYVTKDGWDASQPLTRGALESAPFLSVDKGGEQPSNSESHSGALPAGKSGHHIIFAVWNVADTGNAFYACSDVNFG